MDTLDNKHEHRLSIRGCVEDMNYLEEDWAETLVENGPDWQDILVTNLREVDEAFELLLSPKAGMQQFNQWAQAIKGLTKTHAMIEKFHQKRIAKGKNAGQLTPVEDSELYCLRLAKAHQFEG
jgi:hypothetical protein